MLNLFYVAVGGAAGLLMVALAAVLTVRPAGDGERRRLIFGVGVLGGFTTFSAYSLEIAGMIERRALPQALIYGLGSVLLSVAAVFLGQILARRVLS